MAWTPTRPIVATLISLALMLAALPLLNARVDGQTIPAPVDEILEQAGLIEGLSALDPVLGPVTDVVLQISNAVADGLASTPLVNTVALGGADAVEAAVALSQATFPDGAGTAVLSRQDLFADGFSSGGFQGRFDAPLLFTNSEDLDRRTAMELQRLGMSNITILGGESALNPLVVQKLQIAGLNVTRVGGPTRVETALLAAAVTHPNATKAVLVRAYPDEGSHDSQAYADLLGAGPYAAENGWPLLMTPSESLHPGVMQYLRDAGITEVIIVGGTSAVSQAVEDTVSGVAGTVTRVSGPNRFATAVEIAKARGFNTAADSDRIIIAESGGRDDVWAPGFAATAFSDINSAPVLLSSGATLPLETLNFMAQAVPDTLLDGGPVVVCAPFVDPIACTAAGALMTANLALVEELLGIDLSEIPGIGDILGVLGEQDLLPDAIQELVDALVAGAGGATGAVTDAIGAIVAGDPDGVQEAVQAAADAVTGTAGGVGDALGGGGGGSEPPTDPTEEPSEGGGPTGIDPLDEAIDGIIPGG